MGIVSAANSRIIITHVLFDWAKLQYQLVQKTDHVEDTTLRIKMREKYLKKLDVTNVQLYHKSKEYYTLKYTFLDRIETKKFLVTEMDILFD